MVASTVTPVYLSFKKILIKLLFLGFVPVFLWSNSTFISQSRKELSKQTKTDHVEVDRRFPQNFQRQAQVGAVPRITRFNKNILCVTGFTGYFQQEDFYNLNCG